MADSQDTAPNGVSAALQPDSGQALPRFTQSEVGFTGLRVSNTQIIEEANRVFRFPQFIRVVNEMRNNPTVGAARNVYRMMINRVKWCVEAPVDGSEVDKARAEAIQSMLHDMDMSWEEVIESIFPYIEYGFGINEIVLRRRLNRLGSKYNDGLVGLAKLAPRGQDTIVGWKFADNGSDLVAVEQSLAYAYDQQLYIRKLNEHGRIEIPRDKILLFVSEQSKGNPQGNSIYKNIYLAFKQLTLLQEQQLLGIAKDVQGIMKIEIPAAYLSPDAGDAEKATALAFQKIIDNYNAGTQRGLLVPQMYDTDAKQSMFKYELMTSKGQSPYDIESIIKGLQNDILAALNVDILKLGAEGSGSYNLASQKTSILALAIDSRLREIAAVFNHQLIPKLYAYNGWEQTNMAKFVYEAPEDIDLETFAKAVQQIFAVGAIEVDRDVLNRVRAALGIKLKAEDAPVDKEALSSNLTGSASSAGQGYAPGTVGNGTAKTVPSKDSSAGNKSNS